MPEDRCIGTGFDPMDGLPCTPEPKRIKSCCEGGKVVFVWLAPRCSKCGHRTALKGYTPKQTRNQAPWKWPFELIGRSRARRM